MQLNFVAYLAIIGYHSISFHWADGILLTTPYTIVMTLELLRRGYSDIITDTKPHQHPLVLVTISRV